jgi:hypothetical protein
MPESIVAIVDIAPDGRITRSTPERTSNRPGAEPVKKLSECVAALVQQVRVSGASGQSLRVQVNRRD